MTKLSSIGPTNNLDKREQHGEITRLKWKRLCKISFFHIQYLTFSSFLLTSFFNISCLLFAPFNPTPLPFFTFFDQFHFDNHYFESWKQKRKKGNAIFIYVLCTSSSFLHSFSPKKRFCNKWGYWTCQGYWRLWAFTIMRLLHCYLHLQGEKQNDIMLNVFLKYVYTHHASEIISFLNAKWIV